VVELAVIAVDQAQPLMLIADLIHEIPSDHLLWMSAPSGLHHRIAGMVLEETGMAWPSSALGVEAAVRLGRRPLAVAISVASWCGSKVGQGAIAIGSDATFLQGRVHHRYRSASLCPFFPGIHRAIHIPTGKSGISGLLVWVIHRSCSRCQQL
jgi:hypothetical protein